MEGLRCKYIWTDFQLGLESLLNTDYTLYVLNLLFIHSAEKYFTCCNS